MHQSIYKQGGTVSFPEFTGERQYMIPFTKQQGLPAHLNRWSNTVSAMLDGIDTTETMYLMIDQGIVKAGTSHRRGGVHIDGNWIPELQCHGGPSPGHSFQMMNDESIILASDVTGGAGYTGSWYSEIGEGGDLSHLDLSNLDRVLLKSGIAHVGNVYFLHESIPLEVDTQRTLVRINVPSHLIN